MTRKRIAVLILGFILLACLLACGYFGAKTIRRTYQRHTAMAAYEKKDYEEAERLLLAYIHKDQNSEPEFAALANIYHEFGNTGAEAQMWQMASSLNPLKEEYRRNMLDAAVKSASYNLLYGVLGRKAKLGEKMDEKELYPYVIAACRTGHQKDAEAIYKKSHDANPEAFHKSELGRIAEFLTTYNSLSDAERESFLEKMVKSEDPVVRYEALYSTIRLQLARIVRNGGGADEETIEGLLKQLSETNYFAGTPYLADYYFTLSRFTDTISLADPYLKTIDSMGMYLMHLESCVFEGNIDAIRKTVQKLHEKGPTTKVLADYCGILISYMEKDKQTLAERVRKSGKLISTPLALFIRLQVALDGGSFNEIRTLAADFFAASGNISGELRNQAVMDCVEYIRQEMGKQENQDDLSKMAELAQILIGHVQSSQLLTTIILDDQFKRGVVKEADLLAALDQYPDGPILLHITAEYLIMNGKANQAMPLIERLEEAEDKDARNAGIMFLKMLALDQIGQSDEAAAIFKELVELSQFDRKLLFKYLSYCADARREKELDSMADMLETAEDGTLKQYGTFFRAAALILTEDEAKRDEALKMLSGTKDEDPEFTLYAALRLSEYDWLDEAEPKLKAILKTHPNPSLVYLNLSELYKAKGDPENALKTAKEGFEQKRSGLSAFVYAQRLSEAGRYAEAVEILNLPRRAGNYRKDVLDLWTGCMKKVIEKSIADQRYMQAEEQCKHLLVIVPDDEFGTENLAKARENLKQKKGDAQTEDEAPEAAPAA